MTTQELTAAIGDRPGWRIEGAAAVYAPGAGAWTGRVRPVEHPERADRGWHLAVLHEGVARHSGFGRTAADAVRRAERLVQTCLAPTPAGGTAGADAG